MLLNFIQELPLVLKSIDRMYWSIDRIFETLQDQEQKQKQNKNSFFFFNTNQKLIDSNMKRKTYINFLIKLKEIRQTVK